MRGKRKNLDMPACPYRITPARAGKTRLEAEIKEMRQDHPRACGENLSLGRVKLSPAGSPPRVRGKPSSYYSILTQQRITPARAGKTATADPGSDAGEDHPRACGENPTAAHASAGLIGSPPRVRGKQGRAHPARSIQRITPARAGKTKAQAPQIRGREDHPRACGEN